MRSSSAGVRPPRVAVPAGDVVGQREEVLDRARQVLGREGLEVVPDLRVGPAIGDPAQQRAEEVGDLVDERALGVAKRPLASTRATVAASAPAGEPSQAGGGGGGGTGAASSGGVRTGSTPRTTCPVRRARR